MIEIDFTIILFFIAAGHDILSRRIPDIIPLTIAVVILTTRAIFGWQTLLVSVLAGIAVFVLLFIAYTRNAIGGGDVKLLTAFSLGLPPIETVHFIVMTALAGGVVGLIYLGLARLHPVLRPGRDRFILRRLFIIECWRARRYRTVPYAVAIAAGAASVLLPAMLPARFVL
jgi:prepilin peptidase CpaA